MRKEAIREVSELIHVEDKFDPKKYEGMVAGPAVTIYLPIQHKERERRRDEWDRIEFKDQIKSVKEQLAKQYPNEHDYKVIMEILDYLLKNEDLPIWTEAKESLAFLVMEDGAYVFNLEVDVPANAIVDDHFYLAPLMQNGEQAEIKYKLLLLNSDFFAVLNGNEDGVQYEPLPDHIKHYFAETYPEFDGETTALDYYSLEDHETPYHDHHSRNDVKKEEAKKFFYYVAKAMEKMTHNDPTPVILVTDPEHVHEFREVAKFKTLLPQGIDKDPRTLSGTQLRDAAMKIMESR